MVDREAAPLRAQPAHAQRGAGNQLAASMVEFGWTNPVLVDEQGGILAGHGRLLAARKLGLAEVPVIRFEHLSEAQKRAYLIADNQLALQAGWDDPVLAEELAWLRGESFDLDLVGFDATDLERLLALADGEAGPGDAEDEVPEPPEEPVSRPGDLWVLGNHRLLCGDATTLADVERVLGGQLADMCFTDSPYNVDYANSPKDKLRGKHRPILNDNLGSGFEAFLVRLLRERAERHQGRRVLVQGRARPAERVEHNVARFARVADRPLDERNGLGRGIWRAGLAADARGTPAGAAGDPQRLHGALRRDGLWLEITHRAPPGRGGRSRRPARVAPPPRRRRRTGRASRRAFGARARRGGGSLRPCRGSGWSSGRGPRR